MDAFNLKTTEAGKDVRGSYVVEEGLYLAEDGLRQLDGTWPALGLAQLTQGSQVVHGMGKRLVVAVHQAQALQRGHAWPGLCPCLPRTSPARLKGSKGKSCRAISFLRDVGFRLT